MVRKVMIAYLSVQSVAALLWWALLFLRPEWRAWFKPQTFPDAALLSFVLPDLILFIGAAGWSVHRLLRGAKSLLLPLALHCGAAIYAALFCLMQWLLTGEAVLSMLLMAPCLIVQPWMLWTCYNAE